MAKSLTNKDLINQLSGFSMKSEVELILDGESVDIQGIKRVYIPEDKENRISARNIVQITITKKKID